MTATPDLYETDVAELNRLLAIERQARAELATALEAVSRLCLLRQSGLCYWHCPGQILCRHDGLTILPWHDLPERLKEMYPYAKP